MRNMIKEDREMRIIAAAISSVLIENMSGESIKPSQGRDGGSAWSVSHRRMAVAKVGLSKGRDFESSKRR